MIFEQSMPSCLVGIWVQASKPFPLALRTALALIRLGISPECIHWVRDHCSVSHADPSGFGTRSIFELLDLAKSRRSSIWLLDAGTWPIHPLPHSVLKSSKSLRMIGFGAIKKDRFGIVPSDALATVWERSNFLEVLEGKIGDWVPQEPNAWCSLFIPAGMLNQVRGYPENLEFRASLRGALQVDHTDPIPTVRIDGLDVRIDQRLRIAQVITSLQRGGAERIALDLHKYWLAQDIHAALVAIDAPRRAAFQEPPGFVHSFDRIHRDQRVDACVGFVQRFQPDLVHTHLLSRKEHRAFASLGVPTMTTLHNMPQGWPKEFRQTDIGELDLVVSCAKAVERQAVEALPGLEHRTVWNGISGREFRMELQTREIHRQRIRSSYGIHDKDWVLVALANPRPQKRLERIPRVVSILQDALAETREDRRVHAIFAGEASSNNALACESSQELDIAIETFCQAGTCHRVGSIDNVPEILSAADVLVSVSQYEGLSLAHLEALASGLPVVATDVGGNREIASRMSAMRMVDADCDDREIANAIQSILESRDRGLGNPSIGLHRSFETYTMGRGYHRMLRGLLGKVSRPSPKGLWLVTNNFSVGGAQSSARRLLGKLHERGRRVRVAVLDENPNDPTPGTQSLRNQGIPVFSVPRPLPQLEYSIGVQKAVDHLLDAIDREPPEALVFWNTIPVYKLLLADGLMGVPIYDVSPGEMNLTSLENCLASGFIGLPYQSTLDYGARLSAAVVKYNGEREIAQRAFGVSCPVTSIPNGVPIGNPIGQSTPREPMRIGTSTRLNPHKRVEDLLDALRKLEPNQRSSVELWVAGGVDGALGAYAEQLRTASLDLPVRWLGNVTDIDAFLRELDLFVMISEPAGCPNAILEAMSVGLPVIATDVGGASEMVVHGQSGIIVPTRSPDAMARAIVELLSAPDKRASYAQAARARAIACYSVDRMADDYENLFLGDLDRPAI